MANITKSTIQSCTPRHWVEVEYNNCRYKKFKVPSWTDEFYIVNNKIYKEFGNKYWMEWVERVQHPYALARYIIRRKQVTSFGYWSEHREFITLRCSYKDLEEYIEYNCDDRHSGDLEVRSNPSYIVIIKTLNHEFDERDSDWYPEYIVRVSKNYNYYTINFY